MARRALMRCRECGYGWPVILLRHEDSVPVRRAICPVCKHPNDPRRDCEQLKHD